MPILLSKSLPAYQKLKTEGYAVLAREEGYQPDIRIALLNLMPNKETTEAHFARVLSHTLACVELVFLSLETHQPKTASHKHMAEFYQNWNQVDLHSMQGIILTGAPVEHLPYEKVYYWHEISHILTHIRSLNRPVLYICWAAQAALYHYYSVNKKPLKHKCLGLFPHRIKQADPLLCGFDDVFGVPVARQTEISEQDLKKTQQIDILSDSELSGIYIARDRNFPGYYAFNHLEYTSDTIVEEYFREIQNGKNAPLPYDYFPQENTEHIPLNRWRSHAALFYSNWIHLCGKSIFKPQKTLNLALAGLGTVGGNVLRLLYQNRDQIEQRTGYRIQLVGVSAKNRTKPRPITLPDSLKWVDNPLELATHPKVDILVELIGGTTKTVKDIVHTAIREGKHIVTANKALMAQQGLNLIIQAEAQKTVLAFEAAIGGGIPILKTLREALSSDHVSEIIAILNGTSNYILSEMETNQINFQTALKKAQSLGYAENNPEQDIQGMDSACKLNLLTCIAFAKNTLLNEMPIQGIEHISLNDVQAAKKLNCRIRLLACARKEGEKITCFVQPCLLHHTHRLASITGVHNGILCFGDNIGELFLQGHGAGGPPTATAILADILDIVCNRKSFAFSVPAKTIKTIPLTPNTTPARYYIRTNTLHAIPFPYSIKATLNDHYILLSEPIPPEEISAYRQQNPHQQCLPLYSEKPVFA